MTSNHNYFIHLIADYGVGDPAFGEVIQKLKKLNRNLEIYPTSVPPFSTLATGFWTGQYALYNTFPNLAIFANCAPRRDKKEKRFGNAGEKLVYVKLNNQVLVITVNSGYNLSFVKESIADFRLIKVANQGSQFRSRDFYPDVLVKLLVGDQSVLGPQLDRQKIPTIPPNRIAFIDGYGNIKTTIRRSEVDFQNGQLVEISIAQVKKQAYFVEANFAVLEGQLAFGKGSSGGEDGFLELFLRGGNAWLAFNQPKVETEITFRACE